MKRVLFYVSSMEGGGAERVAALLCNRWVERGHEVILVPTFSGRGDVVYPLDERVRLVFLADVVGTTRGTPWTKIRRLLAMRRLVRETRADVVLSFLTDVNVGTLIATLGMKVPVIVSERIYPPALNIGAIWPRLRRLSYPWASQVVVQTNGGLEWLAHEIPRAKGSVIANPLVFPLPEGEFRLEPDDVLVEKKQGDFGGWAFE